MLCEDGYALSSSVCTLCSDGGTTTALLVLGILAVCTLLVAVAVYRLKIRSSPAQDHQEGTAPNESAAKESAADERLSGAGVGSSVRKLVSSAGSIRGLIGDHLPSVSKSASFLKEKVHFDDADAWSRTGAKGKIVLSFAQVVNQIKFVWA